MVTDMLDRIENLDILAERAALLHFEVDDFLNCVERRERFIEVDAHVVSVKSALLMDILSEIRGELEQLGKQARNSGDAPSPAADTPPADADDNIRAQITDEYAQGIADLISLIETKPDFLKRLRELKKTAMTLAQ